MMAKNNKLLAFLILAAFSLNLNALEQATAEQVGMSSERLQRLDQTLQQYVHDNKIPGIVTAIARKGKVINLKAYGELDTETGTPMKTDSLFRIYSMSKPLVSVAAMILYEEGKFQLNDPVEKYLPEFKNLQVLQDGLEVAQDHAFTIRELMSHSAGFTYGFFGNTEIDQRYRTAKILQNKDLQEMVQRLSEIPLLHQPGSQWHYSVSADVLGRLIEVIAQQDLDDFMQQRLFSPLKMQDTFFEVPADKTHRFGTNHAINPKTGKLMVIDRPATSAFAKNVTLFSGGGGLVSSAPDYLRFSLMLANKGELEGVRLLSRKTIEMMTTNHLGEGNGIGFGESAGGRRNGVGFGLGFSVVEDIAPGGVLTSVGNFSWGGAAGTIFWVDPKEELVVVAMIQHMSSPYPLRQQMSVLTYQAIVD